MPNAPEYVGYNGPGTFVQTGGTNLVATNTIGPSLYVGGNPSAAGYTGVSGSYSLVSGLLSAPGATETCGLQRHRHVCPVGRNE